MTDIKSNIENLELYSDSYPFRLSLKIKTFMSEVDYKKFIRNCEMLVRRCSEYKLWRNYIVDVLQIQSCMITNETMSEVTVQIHHHVPSLYTLVTAIINKKIETQQEFCSFDIAYEAIQLHFQNKIGYVVLITTLHEKFHNGFLTVPIDLVRGDYKYFLEKYSKYLDETELDTIQNRLAVTENNCTWSKDDYLQMSMIK